MSQVPDYECFTSCEGELEACFGFEVPNGLLACDEFSLCEVVATRAMSLPYLHQRDFCKRIWHYNNLTAVRLSRVLRLGRF